MYLDSTTLVDPDDPAGRRVDTSEAHRDQRFAEAHATILGVTTRSPLQASADYTTAPHRPPSHPALDLRCAGRCALARRVRLGPLPPARRRRGRDGDHPARRHLGWTPSRSRSASARERRPPRRGPRPPQATAIGPDGRRSGPVELARVSEDGSLYAGTRRRRAGRVDRPGRLHRPGRRRDRRAIEVAGPAGGATADGNGTADGLPSVDDGATTADGGLDDQVILDSGSDGDR